MCTKSQFAKGSRRHALAVENDGPVLLPREATDETSFSSELARLGDVRPSVARAYTNDRLLHWQSCAAGRWRGQCRSAISKSLLRPRWDRAFCFGFLSRL